METYLKTSLWQQFGAAIDMFDNAINACPDEFWTTSLWNDPNEKPEFAQVWYLAYHTLVWLDLYLTGSSEGFTPPAPFVRGKLPESPYTKDQIRNYLVQCRRKCRETIETMTDERAQQVCKFAWMEPTFFELQIYSMRHVQEHAAQLSLLIGRDNVTLTDWVAKAEDKSS